MREIKFRGLSLNGDWYYGLLSIVTNRYHDLPPPGSYISNSSGSPFAYSVRPESVCQCTGLRYIGNDIYEGDIVKLTGSQGEFIDEIVFRCGSFMCFDRPVFYCISGPEDKAEIIGNKFENPELLKNSQQQKSS